MKESIREMYNGLSKSDRKTFREMVMKKFDLGEDAVFNRLKGIRTPFSFKEAYIIANWFEVNSAGKYQLKANEEVFDLAGIPYPVELNSI